MRNIATTRILHAPENASTRDLHPPWVWPLPGLDGVAPCILTPMDETSQDSVDIGYPDRSGTPMS